MAKKKQPVSAKQLPKVDRIKNARPDTLDFRDLMYVPTLFEVPTAMPLEDYLKMKVPVLDQGQEGACTGFGLATVINYLLRRRKYLSDQKPVSPRMLYEMAKRYDEWPGENYSGSSARGAMKGWHKHGVCENASWLYKFGVNDAVLNDARSSDALKRPLGAYYRVNHQDLVAIHSAIAEVGIVYATSAVHTGWDTPDSKTGVIPYEEKLTGGHAFAIVGYDERGFWMQNSWGKTWGKSGCGLITYDDWLANGTDIWVARLGAPVTLFKSLSTASVNSSASGLSSGYSVPDVRPHIVAIGNNGVLRPGGEIGTNQSDVENIFNDDFERITATWTKKRLLLYAHGGLVSEASAIQRVADYRPALLAAEVYPISFIWKSDFFTTTSNILQDAFSRRKPEGFLDNTKDFMLDRLDDALEPLARSLSGHLQWSEMKENAMMATTAENGGARFTLQLVKKLAEKHGNSLEIHVVGHSAGAIFHAPLVEMLTKDLGLQVKTCALWAPACTTDVFKQYYTPAIKSKAIENFAMFTMTDKAERDDNCARIYNKSLLYLVSDAFEEVPRIPLFRPNGTPILGMQKFSAKDKDINDLFGPDQQQADWILSPNDKPAGDINASGSVSHGGFDDDQATVKATLARILGKTKVNVEFSFNKSASSLKNTRNMAAGQQNDNR